MFTIISGIAIGLLTTFITQRGPSSLIWWPVMFGLTLVTVFVTRIY